ncbi:hypothetical protein M2266_006125 [Streptomyces sp. SPB162]|nr:hypothetical protein [Streptomyces sp. SPB162]
MDAQHRVPVVLFEVDEHPVAQEPGVVDEGVEPPERIDRGGDQGGGPCRGGDVVAVGDRFAAQRPNLVDDPLGRPRRAARAVEADPEVVDDDARALAREGEGVGAAEAAPRAGDDGDPPRADFGSGHVSSPCSRLTAAVATNRG